VFVIASALYLPLLGGYGLWDPWETHYGDVAREILSRDDWISLWWAQDRWFWSKPILIFWAEALVWSGSGVGFHADQHAQHTDWVLRLPIYLMSVAGLVSGSAAIAPACCAPWCWPRCPTTRFSRIKRSRTCRSSR
jgi:4-amino-4-deoxy-L-arabinose transferase-like glycosyltransferase